MASLLSFGADAMAGGVFGIIGTTLGRVASYFECKQTFAQEEKRWGHELQLHELQMRASKQESEMEMAIAAQWVINILRLVRPLLTLLLWLITAWIFARTQDGEIANAAIFAATAATRWWFGDRAPIPKLSLS